jgi:hypothetical protein
MRGWFNSFFFDSCLIGRGRTPATGRRLILAAALFDDAHGRI